MDMSVSRFDGRVIGPRSPSAFDYRLDDDLSPSQPVRVQPEYADDPMNSVSKFDGRPIGPSTNARYTDDHRNDWHEPRHSGLPHHEEESSTDCIGGGNSLWKRLQDFFVPSAIQAPLSTNTEGSIDVPNRTYQEPQWRYADHGRAHQEMEPYSLFDENVDGVRKSPAQMSRHSRWRPYCRKALVCAAVSCAVVPIFGLMIFLFGFAGHSFDCESALLDARDGWSMEKKAWCCERKKKGCELQSLDRVVAVVAPNEANLPITRTTTTTSTTGPYHCVVGNQRHWPPGKMAWCCLTMKIGCPITTTPIPYNCEADFQNWKNEWSKSKQIWCCNHQRVGCVQSHPDTANHLVLPPKPMGPHFDCEDAFHQWQDAWSVTKKAWCCEFENKGCPDMISEADPITRTSKCDVKCYYQNEDATCQSRVMWLKQHQSMSCATSLAKVLEECPMCGGCALADLKCTDNFACDAEIPEKSALKDWQIGKMISCCEKKGLDCEHLPFNCAAGYGNCVGGWSEEKKKWCADHTTRKCSTQLLP